MTQQQQTNYGQAQGLQYLGFSIERAVNNYSERVQKNTYIWTRCLLLSSLTLGICAILVALILTYGG